MEVFGRTLEIKLPRWVVCLATALIIGSVMFAGGWCAGRNHKTDNPVIDCKTNSSRDDPHPVAEMEVSPGNVKAKTFHSSPGDLHQVAEVLPGVQSPNSSLKSDYIANVERIEKFVGSCEPICMPEHLFSGFVESELKLGKKYHPDKGIVCRCPTHSGCCSNPKHTCKPIETKWVEPVYNVTHQDGTSSLERLRWENVTRCACLPDEDGPK